MDKLLTFLAACVACIAAVDPIGLPTWAQGVAAVLAVGFTAIGVWPNALVSRAHTPRREPSGRM